MITVVTICLACDEEVHLSDHDVQLRIRTPFEGEYRFTCPTCCKRNRKDADERVIRLLLSGGIMPICDHVPLEAMERKPDTPIPPDEVLAFHHTLQDADDRWFDELVRMTGR